VKTVSDREKSTSKNDTGPYANWDNKVRGEGEREGKDKGGANVGSEKNHQEQEGDGL